jgi:hypothetical protein
MSVTLLDDHVLLPHRPDWSRKPKWQRLWRTEIADAVTGAEERASLWEEPRISLTFTLNPADNVERRKLEDRVLAAKKSGKAVTPFWGRATRLTSPASGYQLQMQSSLWPWAIGDYLFFLGLEGSDQYEIRTVAAVSGSTLHLDDDLSRSYEEFVWPLLFGKFVCKEFRTADGWHSSFQVQILYMPENVPPLLNGTYLLSIARNAKPDVLVTFAKGRLVSIDGLKRPVELFEEYGPGPATGLSQGLEWDGAAVIHAY